MWLAGLVSMVFNRGFSLGSNSTVSTIRPYTRKLNWQFRFVIQSSNFCCCIGEINSLIATTAGMPNCGYFSTWRSSWQNQREQLYIFFSQSILVTPPFILGHGVSLRSRPHLVKLASLRHNIRIFSAKVSPKPVL